MANTTLPASFLSSSSALSSQVHASPTPFYYFPHPQLFPSFSDEILALLAPLLAYWLYSLFFALLDTLPDAWLGPYRIHPSAEVSQRNRASRTDVLLAVLFQQAIQTLMGWMWIGGEDPETCLKSETWVRDVLVVAPVRMLLEPSTAEEVLNVYGISAVRFLYWWALPAAQLVFAMFIIDTWQYFLHRAMHTSPFLYRSFHSWHHRLYVPYAFGALYNHPLEGFILDTVGAVGAQLIARMGARQAALLFALSTLKTVDDHCGYRLPLDPLQMLFGNNADYHDIHHQIAGIKSNFAQPFFVHWDTILGTRMTRVELEQRKLRSKAKAGKDL